MADETANQDDILRRLIEAVKNLNAVLKEAEDAALPLGVTFPLRANTASVSVWQYEDDDGILDAKVIE